MDLEATLPSRDDIHRHLRGLLDEATSPGSRALVASGLPIEPVRWFRAGHGRITAVPTWLIWLSAAAVLAAAELLSLDLVLIMLAGGAAAAGAAAAFDATLLAQAVVFAVVSAMLLFMVRPVARRHLRVGRTRTGVEALTGSPAVVIEAVNAQSGQVKIGGEVWSARAYDSTQILAAGEQVHVMEISGATALVWRQP